MGENSTAPAVSPSRPPPEAVSAKKTTSDIEKSFGAMLQAAAKAATPSPKAFHRPPKGVSMSVIPETERQQAAATREVKRRLARVKAGPVKREEDLRNQQRSQTLKHWTSPANRMLQVASQPLVPFWLWRTAPMELPPYLVFATATAAPVTVAQQVQAVAAGAIVMGGVRAVTATALAEEKE